MKKSLIAVLILVLVIALEALALYFKAKNPEPTVFALDTQEYALPMRAIKVSPLTFETDFVEVADKALSDVQFVIENSFARRLSQSVMQLVSQQEMETLRQRERQRKLDEFRQAMAVESTEIRGVYLGDNMCEIDGVKGICANGVYTLGEHCIACFDGVCAGAKCAKKPATETAEGEAENIEDTTVAQDEPQVNEDEPQVEDNPQQVVETAEQGELREILRQAEEASAAEAAKEETVTAEIKAEVAENRDKPVAEELPQPQEVAGAEPQEVVAVAEEVKVEPAAEKVAAAEEIKAEPEEKAETVAEEKAPVNNKAVDEKKALVAVVIDDVGLSIPFTNQLAGINKPITVSFLPYGASDKKQVMQLKNAGLEVMLHVPMMPHKPASLAPVTLSPKMSKAEIQEKLAVMIDRFAGTGMHGLNNHMGSAFTEDREALSAVMEILKERKMFFLDSVTTGKSVGRSVSREYGVPFVARDVFLDNERNYDYIMGQFRETERVARKKGYAIAIGHPYPQTMSAMRDWLKQTDERNIQVVPLSYLVNKLN